MTAAPATFRWLGLIALIAVLIAVSFLLPVRPLVEAASAAVSSAGAWGPVAFVAIYVIATLLLVPGSALTIAAGALFGLLQGLLLAWLASVATAAVAFLLARHVARKPVERLARRHRSWGAFEHAIASGGWKIVALLRLSPVVPFSVSNYFFGLTRVRFVEYVAASAVAMLPGTFLFVYLGHLGMEGVSSFGHGAHRSPWYWALLVVGLIATIVGVVYVSSVARRELHRRHAR
jgi:uncharacterized membrane protein YdjX (TVP38/TMEM64 family)